MYTSPDVQNQIIDMLGDYVPQKILSQVQKAQIFTLIAEEVTDCSNKEQLSLILCFVDRDSSQIREDLVTFIECDTGVTGRNLADKMLSFLRSQGLDLTKMRGQAYDGAGNMSGKTNDAAALISREYPLALYLHCASHCLNLAVVKSLGETNIRNMMGIVDKVWVFFSSHPKQQRKFEEAIETTQPEAKIKKLKDLMGNERLSSLALLHLHRDIDIRVEDILDEFTRRHPRRLQLVDILS